MTWSFILVNLFFRPLSLEFQEAAQLGVYILADLSNLPTFLLQEQALQILHEHGVIVFKLLTEKNRRIRRIMTTFNNGRDTFQNLLVDSNYSNSNADQTI